MAIQCAGAILVQGETLLLGRRASHLRSYPGCWDIIGGHVEDGETLEQALVREVAEEIGVTPVDFAKLTSLRFADGSRSAGELHLYRVDAWRGGAPAVSNDEHSELGWFTVEAACTLPDLASAEFISVFQAIRKVPTVVDESGRSRAPIPASPPARYRG